MWWLRLMLMVQKVVELMIHRNLNRALKALAPPLAVSLVAPKSKVLSHKFNYILWSLQIKIFSNQESKDIYPLHQPHKGVVNWLDWWQKSHKIDKISGCSHIKNLNRRDICVTKSAHNFSIIRWHDCRKHETARPITWNSRISSISQPLPSPSRAKQKWNPCYRTKNKK